MWKVYFYLLTAECCICMLVQRHARGARAAQCACGAVHGLRAPCAALTCLLVFVSRS
jgi:hypothetical protein